MLINMDEHKYKLLYSAAIFKFPLQLRQEQTHPHTHKGFSDEPQ